MFRMAKLTDYGIVLLSQFAARQEAGPLTARELAEIAKLPQPTVGKLLKQLSHNGLLTSLRGTKGAIPWPGRPMRSRSPRSSRRSKARWP